MFYFIKHFATARSVGNHRRFHLFHCLKDISNCLHRYV